MDERKSVPKTGLTKEARLAKNAQIRATMKATKERHAKMTCKVYELKVDYSHLSYKQKESLKRMFLEAKWLRNYALSESRFDRNFLKEINGQVEIRTKHEESVRAESLKVVGGQLAQSILDELKQNLNTLAALKKSGRKVGKLRFKSVKRSINLPQFGVSHKINRDKSRVKVANIPGWMRVRGLNQLPDDIEFSNAKLVQSARGYFLKLTGFEHPENKKSYQPGTEVGLDMGIKTHITLSNGTKLNAVVEESDRCRRLRKKLSRQEKGSNRYRKTWALLNSELEKITNRRNDIANKVVHEILKNETVYFQDEQIASWKRATGYIHGGRRIHGSILGRVKAKLKSHPRAVMLDRSVATTATCVCGKKTKHTPDKRTYECEFCGYTADRDTHAARNMILLGKAQNSPGVGHTRTLVEIPIRPSAVMSFRDIANLGVESLKREASTSSVPR